MELRELLDNLRENFNAFKDSKKTIDYHFLVKLGFEELFLVDESERDHYDHSSEYEHLVEWLKETEDYKVKVVIHNCNRDLPYHPRPDGVHVFIDSTDKHTGETRSEELCWIDSPNSILEHEK